MCPSSRADIPPARLIEDLSSPRSDIRTHAQSMVDSGVGFPTEARHRVARITSEIRPGSGVLPDRSRHQLLETFCWSDICHVRQCHCFRGRTRSQSSVGAPLCSGNANMRRRIFAGWRYPDPPSFKQRRRHDAQRSRTYNARVLGNGCKSTPEQRDARQKPTSNTTTTYV